MKQVFGWEPVSGRTYMLIMKDKPFNYNQTSLYEQIYDKPKVTKDEFCGEYPYQDDKMIIGDANSLLEYDNFFRPVIRTESLYFVTHNNGLRLVTFAATGNQYYVLIT